VASATCGTPG